MLGTAGSKNRSAGDGQPFVDTSDHVRRRGHAVVAGVARKHAQAVRAAGRRALDISASAGPGRRRHDLFDRPIVITHSDFRFIAAEQMRQCDIEADIVLEPSRRDSAMAVAVAAELAGRRRTGATCVLVLAADHVVRDAEALQTPAGKRPRRPRRARL